MLARRVVPPVDGTFLAVAAIALQKKSSVLTPTQPTHRATIASQRAPPPYSDPPPLRLTATIVRNRRDVLDHRHANSSRLDRSQRGFPPCSRPLHPNLDSLQPLVLGLSDRFLARQLSREGCALARPLETFGPSTRPRDHVTRWIGDRDNRIVEGRPDVNDPDRNHFSDLLLLGPCRFCRRRQRSLSKSSQDRRSTHCHLGFGPVLPRRGPFRVRELVLVRCPRTGSPFRWRRPR